jgi:hypothetical protein
MTTVEQERDTAELPDGSVDPVEMHGWAIAIIIGAGAVCLVIAAIAQGVV